jgi:hypothetical protein
LHIAVPHRVSGYEHRRRPRGDHLGSFDHERRIDAWRRQSDPRFTAVARSDDQRPDPPPTHRRAVEPATLDEQVIDDHALFSWAGVDAFETVVYAVEDDDRTGAWATKLAQ